MATIELVWRAEACAAVWKVSGITVGLRCNAASEAPTKGAGRGRGGGRAGRKEPQPQATGGRRTAPTTVCAWAGQELEGEWEPLHDPGPVTAGLVLIARPHAFSESHAPTLRGTFAALVAPQNVGASEQQLGQSGTSVEALWEPLGLFGRPEEEARVIQEAPSGHFGHLAIIELEVELNGRHGTSPLDVVLGLQALGFGVVRLNGVKGSELRNPTVEAQVSSQEDVLPGTCLALVAVKLPPGLPHRGAAKTGRVSHALPAKFAKLLSVEGALAEQRRCPEDGLVTFRGFAFLAPGEQLKPRPSSSAIVDAVLDSLETSLGSLRARASVLDLGVGCGALLLSILHSLGGASSGTGVDIDAEAVETCGANAARLLDDAALRVSAVEGDMGKLDSPSLRPQLATEGYDAIVCNPPYRSEEQQANYDRASGSFGGHTEHAKTLVAGKTGLELYEAAAACLARDAAEAIAAGRKPLLKDGGVIVFQVEAGIRGKPGGAADRVGKAVERASGGLLSVLRVHVDVQGLERAIIVSRASQT